MVLDGPFAAAVRGALALPSKVIPNVALLVTIRTTSRSASSAIPNALIACQRCLNHRNQICIPPPDSGTKANKKRLCLNATKGFKQSHHSLVQGLPPPRTGTSCVSRILRVCANRREGSEALRRTGLRCDYSR